MHRNNGFVPIIAILIVVVLATIGGFFILLNKQKMVQPEIETLPVGEKEKEELLDRPTQTDNKRLYTNTKFFNFSFQAPDGWFVKEGGSPSENGITLNVVPELQMLENQEVAKEKIAFRIIAYKKAGTFEESLAQFSFYCGAHGCDDFKQVAEDMMKTNTSFTVNGSKAYKIQTEGCSDAIYLDGSNFILMVGMFDVTADINCTEGASQFFLEFAGTFKLL